MTTITAIDNVHALVSHEGSWREVNDGDEFAADDPFVAAFPEFFPVADKVKKSAKAS